MHDYQNDRTASINPYYPYGSGGVTSAPSLGTYVGIEPKLVSDIKKVIELFVSEVIDKNTAVSIIEKHLDRHSSIKNMLDGPKGIESTEST